MENIIIAILGSSVLSALVSGLFNYLNDRRKEKKGEGKCLTMLMADAVYTKGEKLSNQPKVSREEKKLFDDMYDLYKAMGGNGYSDDLKAIVKNKPIDMGDSEL